MLCIVAKQYVLHQVAEQVNRKCPPRNTAVQLSTSYTHPAPSNSLPPKFHMYNASYVFVVLLLWICLSGVVIAEYTVSPHLTVSQYNFQLNEYCTINYLSNSWACL